MDTIDNGGSAFPVTNPQFIYKAGGDAAKSGTTTDERDRLYMEATERAASGMSLRDYFAAKAMQGFASTARDLSRASDAHLREEFDFVSRVSYLMADAMLRARGSA